MRTGLSLPLGTFQGGPLRVDRTRVRRGDSGLRGTGRGGCVTPSRTPSPSYRGLRTSTPGRRGAPDRESRPTTPRPLHPRHLKGRTRDRPERRPRHSKGFCGREVEEGREGRCFRPRLEVLAPSAPRTLDLGPSHGGASTFPPYTEERPKHKIKDVNFVIDHTP